MKQTVKRPLFVAFSTQKGGVGKTTMTVLVAGYLHYTKGIHVAVVDCDNPQHSIVNERRRESEAIEKDSVFRRKVVEHSLKHGMRAYPVRMSTPQRALEDAGLLIGDTPDLPEIIFFDLPGTVNSEGVFKTLSQMDYIFTPLSADHIVLDSTLTFAKVIDQKIVKKGLGNLKAIHLFWNMVDAREKTPLYEIAKPFISALAVSVLDTRIPNSVRFRKEMLTNNQAVFRSTVLPADNSLLGGSKIRELSHEICNTINLKL